MRLIGIDFQERLGIVSETMGLLTILIQPGGKCVIDKTRSLVPDGASVRCITITRGGMSVSSERVE